MVEISQNSVAISEHMKFNTKKVKDKNSTTYPISDIGTVLKYYSPMNALGKTFVDEFCVL